MILADEFGETAGTMPAGECGAVHVVKLPESVVRGKREKPQAIRGDLHELTAATFTVLTGFARSSPTGLGRVKVGSPDQTGNVTGRLSNRLR